VVWPGRRVDAAAGCRDACSCGRAAIAADFAGRPRSSRPSTRTPRPVVVARRRAQGTLRLHGAASRAGRHDDGKQPIEFEYYDVRAKAPTPVVVLLPIFTGS